MSRARLRIAAALMPLLFVGSPFASLKAQEIPRPEVPRESEAARDRNQTPEERKAREDLEKAAKGHFSFKIPEGEKFETRDERREERLHPKPVEIYWKRDATGKSRYAPYRIEDGQQIPLTEAQILALYQSGKKILNTGAATRDPDWHAYTVTAADRAIIHEEESANRNTADLNWAMEVAGRPLDPAKTVVFSALPQQSSPQAFANEKQRMKIGGTGTAWADLNGRIERSRGKFPPAKIATREALLAEFATGTSNMILVYAHFDGNMLHMPDANGKRGEGISMDDFAALADRPDARDRVIVLVACSTAKAIAGNSSLVSLLLKKRLARAVLATAFPYDAQKIPAFLQNLSAGKLPAQADPQLRQYVDMDWRIIQVEPPFSRHPESEVTSHG